MNLLTDDEDTVILATFYQAISNGKAINKARALIADIQGTNCSIAKKPVLQETAIAREKVIRAERGINDDRDIPDTINADRPMPIQPA